MTTEDKSQIPLFSPGDEKETQKAPDHHSTNGTLKATNKWTGFQGKTMWDWLQLLGVLAIPLVVAGATLLFGIQQANLANQQHENDQKQALDQQQAAILQTYIDNIQDLLLHDNLLKSKPGDVIAILARARTLSAMRQLDGKRNSFLVQFLQDAGLIGAASRNIVNFEDADLSSTDLSYADLSGANLSGANLSDADLIAADLSNADLRNADLRNAHNLTQQQLDQVPSCKGAILPPGLICNDNE